MKNYSILADNKKRYNIEYEEIEVRNLFGLGIKPTVKVYLESELLLSSKKLNNEEFYNCLKFLVPNDVFEYTRMILETGYENEYEDNEDNEDNEDWNNNDLYGYDMFDDYID